MVFVPLPPAGKNETIVVLMSIDGEWCVRGVKKGKETIITFLCFGVQFWTPFDTFPLEIFAVAYADEQRRRLGLEGIVRLQTATRRRRPSDFSHYDNIG
jgi:hypothetical protein